MSKALTLGTKFKDASKASDQDAIFTQYILKMKTNIKRATINKVIKILNKDKIQPLLAQFSFSSLTLTPVLMDPVCFKDSDILLMMDFFALIFLNAALKQYFS